MRSPRLMAKSRFALPGRRVSLSRLYGAPARRRSPHLALGPRRPTSLANLALLCEFHHRQVHECGFEIVVLGQGCFRFLRPDGQWVPENPPSGPAAGWLEDALGDLEITAETILSSWGGERLDLDAALFSLLNRPEPSSTVQPELPDP